MLKILKVRRQHWRQKHQINEITEEDERLYTYIGGKEMFFDCSECFKKVSDTQICEDKQERIICQNCYANSQRQKAKINL